MRKSENDEICTEKIPADIYKSLPPATSFVPNSEEAGDPTLYLVGADLSCATDADDGPSEQSNTNSVYFVHC